MTKRKGRPPCPTCGAKPDEECRSTLAPEGQQSLSVKWQHFSRDEADK